MKWMIGLCMLCLHMLTGCQIFDARPFRAPILHGEHFVIGILDTDRPTFDAGLLQALRPIDVSPETIDPQVIDGLLISHNILATLPQEPVLQKDIRQILASGVVLLFYNTSPEEAARQVAVPLHGAMHSETDRLVIGSLVQTQDAGIIPGRLLIPFNKTLNDSELAQDIRDLLQEMLDVQQRFSEPTIMPQPAHER
jgi:hypothetical protein